MPRRVVPVLVVWAALLASPCLHAEPDVWAKPLAVMAEVGFGTPVGYYGLNVETAPVPGFVLSAGAGFGSGTYCKGDFVPPRYAGVCASFTRDLQVALLGRARVLRSGHDALSIGGGFSEGGYTWVELTTDEPAYKTSALAQWLDAEISWEHRAAGGFSTRLFTGYAWMLDPGRLECVSWGAGSTPHSHCVQDHAGDGERLLYLGAALGMAF